jgi:hypothetical protein
MDFYIRDQLHKQYSTFNRDRLKYKVAVHQPFMYGKKRHDSIRREVLHSILTEFGILQN